MLVALHGCSRSGPLPDRTSGTPSADAPLCSAACEHIAACEPPPDFPGVPTCVADCAKDPRNDRGRRGDELRGYEACLVRLSCDDTRLAQERKLPAEHPCARALAAFLACEPAAPLPSIDFKF